MTEALTQTDAARVATAEVTVVVANYQGEAVLPDCLGTLRAQTRPPRDVLVVDAGSTDGGTEIAEDFGATVIATENRGVGWLYNTGARAAGTPLVALVNNDVAFAPDWLELVTAALERDPDTFAADSTQLDWEGSSVIHRRSRISRGPLIRQPLPGFRLDKDVRADEPVATLYASGAAMLARRDRLLELGGFDESFFMEFEELDVCWRAWLRGWKTIHVPHATLRHRFGWTTALEQAHDQRVASAHYNLLRFALKCLPASGVARVLAGELLRLPVHPRLVGPAVARIARSLPEIVRQRSAARPSRAVYEWLLDGQPEGFR